jgi:hypothetical protein
MVSGITMKKERERQMERDKIVNDQTQQLIAESAARVKNYEFEQRRRTEADQIAQTKAEVEAKKVDAEQATQEQHLRRTAAYLAQQTKGDPEDIYATIVSGGTGAINSLLANVPDPESERDQVALRKAKADADNAVGDLQYEHEQRNLLADPMLARYRRAIQSYDEAEGERLHNELAKKYPTALGAWEDDHLPDPNAPLSAGARATAKTDGKLTANSMVQSMNGDAIAALADAQAMLAEAPPEDKFMAEKWQAIIDELEVQAKAQSAGNKRKPGISSNVPGGASLRDIAGGSGR